MNQNKKYLTVTVPSLLNTLNENDEPAFGIMTARHMVEHLIWVTKSSIKDFGPPPDEMSDKQIKFVRFIDKGAHFKHRHSDKKREDIDPPRLPNLNKAIGTVSEAIDRLYAQSSDRVFYNPMMGILSFDQIELFHAQHYKYHLEEQFGLSEKVS